MAIASREQLRHDLFVDPYFGDAVRFVFANVGDVNGKLVLDNGCGSGEIGILFALEGAQVIGLDKREAALGDARRLAGRYHAQHSLLFVTCNSEEMPIADGSVDVIFSRSTIQYMKYDVIILQYMRILKDDGVLAIIENLRYSPIINFYRLFRRYTARSPADIAYVNSIYGYITVKQAEKLAEKFISSVHREFHFFRIASIYLGRWLGRGVAVRKVDGLLAGVDNGLFRLFPVMRHVAWFTALVCWKKRHG
ncbi:MAG: class I SAM-dependent methyltransferase [Sphingomonas sp.]|jgi:ubiquinone/menaquinone biosynthesis C-methylase UbiE|uniref:class I SAM-dependent methyltransferase n=1 Tax=Sphingomonas sp. TaxID=28214 RepID=UPI003564C64C